MNSKFESERVVFGSWTDTDARQVFKIYGDAEVAQWLGGVSDADVSESQKRLESYASRTQALKRHRCKDGEPDSCFGIWPVFLKSNGDHIGTMMLKPMPDADGVLTDDIEIGWHLRRDQWGKGFATECGQRMLDYGFESNVTPICAVMSSENHASQSVAKRLGMTHFGQTDAYYGMTVELYKMEKN